MQHVTSLSFLLLAYSNYLSHANKVVPCGERSASPALLKQLAKRQVIIYKVFNLFFFTFLFLLKCKILHITTKSGDHVQNQTRSTARFVFMLSK